MNEVNLTVLLWDAEPARPVRQIRRLVDTRHDPVLDIADDFVLDTRRNGYIPLAIWDVVRRGVVLGCALDFPRPLGGLRSLGEGWWRSLGSVSAGEALGT